MGSPMTEQLDMAFGYNLIDTGSSDDYYTPSHIFEALGIEFDLDVAAPDGGIPWIPAKRYYTIIDDGLASPWEGTVWMNPPYSAPRKWIEKFIDHGDGICLVPTSKANWFKQAWDQADGVMCMDPALKFVRGNSFAQIQYLTIMFAMGDKSIAALKRSGLGRVR